MTNVVLGVDVSKWQGSINWPEVAANGVSFVIPRSSYRNSVDSYFMTNVTNALAAGVKVPGVYHFLYTKTVEEACNEAVTAVQACVDAGLPKSTIIFADYEYDTISDAAKKGVTLTKADCNTLTDAFCKAVETSGYRSGIYLNKDFYKNYYESTTLANRVIWLADYTDSPDYECNYWQTSSSGSVNGITGDVDMDCMYSDPGESEYTTADLLSVEEVAKQVIEGLWGNGDTRKSLLAEAGYDYVSVQAVVNQLLTTGTTKKSDEEVAQEVLKGIWGNGNERKTMLEAAGYDYSSIQMIVNQLMRSN